MQFFFVSTKQKRNLQNTSLIKSLTFEKLEYEYLDSVYDINGIESFN